MPAKKNTDAPVKLTYSNGATVYVASDKVEARLASGAFTEPKAGSKSADSK